MTSRPSMNSGLQSYSGYRANDVRLADFSGGRVNVPEVVGPTGVGLSEAVVAQNVDVLGGSIRKMRGFTKVTTEPVEGDISSLFYDTVTKTVFVGYASSIGKLNGDVIEPLDDEVVFAENTIWSFCRFGDFVFMANGVDEPQKWDDDAGVLSSITTPPVVWGEGNYPTTFFEWAGRVFAFGCAGNPDFLFYSKLYDGDDWTPDTTADAGGAIQVGNDGRGITAVIPLARGLVILKDPGLYYLFGNGMFNNLISAVEFDQTTFDWDLLTEEAGCVGPRAWVVVGDTAYMWGRHAVYRVRHAEGSVPVSVDIISEKIAYDVKHARFSREQVCAVHYPERNQVWFGVCDDIDGKINKIHCYGYLTSDRNAIGGWTLRTGYKHKCMAEVYDDNGLHQIYSGGYADAGYIYRQNVGVDFDDKPMECVFRSSWVPLGAAAAGKTHHVILMFGSRFIHPIQYTYAYDFDEGYYDSIPVSPEGVESVWNSSGSEAVWHSGGELGTWNASKPEIRTFRVFGRGRRMQHRFYSNLAGADFDILEILHPVTSTGYAS